MTKTEADVVIPSTRFDEELAETFRRLRMPKGLLERLAGIKERRGWAPGRHFTDGATEAGDEEALAAIRSAVAAAHGITPEVIEMRAPGEIKRSASGKIARRVNRNDFLAR